MSKLLKVTVLALLFAVLWGAAGQLHATIGKASYIPKFEPLSYVKSTGEVKLKFTLEKVSDHPQAVWDEVTLTAYGVDLKYRGDTARLDIRKLPLDISESLEYYGDSAWLARFDEQGLYSTTFHLTVPDNDTSCFVILLEFDGYSFYQGQCFVTTGNTLNTFIAWPNYWGALQLERSNRRKHVPREEHERAKREWEERQEQLKKHKSKGTTKYLHGLSAEEVERMRSESSKTITMDSLHKLEETPLTDYSGQFIQVGDTLYVRREGEYKFKLAETYSSREEMEQSRRNREPDWSREDHIVMDLRKQEDYDFVKELVDSLIPMEKEGYYHIVTTLRVIDKIKSHRIEYTRYPRYPDKLTPPPKPGPSKTKPPRHPRPRGSSTDGQLPAWDLLFYDGFESSFPGSWTVYDNNADNGYDYWWKLDDCTPSAGFWSAWCAGAGDMIPCWYYDLNMDAYMSKTYEIDIQDYTDIEVDFDILYSTESYYDYMEAFLWAADVHIGPIFDI